MNKRSPDNLKGTLRKNKLLKKRFLCLGTLDIHIRVVVEKFRVTQKYNPRRLIQKGNKERARKTWR